MSTLFSVMILCCVADEVPNSEELTKFKQDIQRPESVLVWLIEGKNRDAIDLVPPQYKDLRDAMFKYGRQLKEIKREMREKHPYPVDPATGQIVGIEACRAHDRYLKAVAKASAPVKEAWRKEIREILSPSQIAKMNEIRWQKKGTALLFAEDFQRVLKLDQQQRATLEELYRWSTEATGNEPGGLGGDPVVMAAKEIEAQEKALELLTPEQRKAFDFLLGHRK